MEINVFRLKKRKYKENDTSKADGMHCASVTNPFSPTD